MVSSVSIPNSKQINSISSVSFLAASCVCNDPSGVCVMSAVSGHPPPEQWSSCSESILQTALEGSIGLCLNNEPTSILSDPVCGNGIREGDEICDCGSEEVGCVYKVWCACVLHVSYWYKCPISYSKSGFYCGTQFRYCFVCAFYCAEL